MDIPKLTPRETKFLTILDETRLADNKMFGRYADIVKEQFQFSNKELKTAVAKLLKLDLLTKINAGGDEMVYFHTEKVNKIKLDEELSKIRH
jgi:DNA polymerase III delta subunit